MLSKRRLTLYKLDDISREKMVNFSIFRKIFGNPNERLLKTAQPFIEKINSLSKEMKNSSDNFLSGKTS